MSLPVDSAGAPIIDAINAWRSERTPLLVAIDGHGAAGKSTIAAAVCERLGAALVHTDDFFRQRDAVAPAGPPMSRYYDWQRLREEALAPLLAGQRARFRAFDWERDAFLAEPVTVTPAAVVVLEGVSSAAPALADLLTHAILVQTPEVERTRRLRARISESAWDARWLQEELRYFASLPPERFELTVSGSATGAPGD